MTDKDPYMDSPEFSQATPNQYHRVATVAIRQLRLYGREAGVEDGTSLVAEIENKYFYDLSDYQQWDYASVEYSSQVLSADGLELQSEFVAFVFSQEIMPPNGDPTAVLQRHIYIGHALIEDQKSVILAQVVDECRFEGESIRTHLDDENYSRLDITDMEAVAAQLNRMAADRAAFEELVKPSLTVREAEQLFVIAERIR